MLASKKYLLGLKFSLKGVCLRLNFSGDFRLSKKAVKGLQLLQSLLGKRMTGGFVISPNLTEFPL